VALQSLLATANSVFSIFAAAFRTNRLTTWFHCAIVYSGGKTRPAPGSLLTPKASWSLLTSKAQLVATHQHSLKETPRSSLPRLGRFLL